MPDPQNNNLRGCHVVDDDIRMHSHQLSRAICPSAPTFRTFSETFGCGFEAKGHTPSRSGIEMADVAADGDQVGNSSRGKGYFHDGAGRSSTVPQLSSQRATSLKGIVCPAAACARAWATARVSASSSVGSKTVAGSAMAHLHAQYKRRAWIKPCSSWQAAVRAQPYPPNTPRYSSIYSSAGPLQPKSRVMARRCMVCQRSGLR